MINKKSIYDILINYKNQEVDFLTNHGNIGDTLIFKGTLVVMEKLNIRLRLVENITQNRNNVLFVSGGGNLIDHYSVLKTWLLPRVQQATYIYDNVIILPHTIFGEKTVSGLKPFINKIDIICREFNSYKFLSKHLPHSKLHVSDDMAFHLDFTSIQQKGKETLNVIRTDGEKTNLPIPLNNIDLSEEFDIGKPYQHNYWELSYWEEFPLKLVEYINKYEKVITNRLHVAIASALLNKQTIIHPNSYFKNKAIYETSLKHFENVNFIDSRD